MTDTAFTPGPWRATPIAQGTGDYCIHARGIPWQLAYLAENSQIDWPVEANARLIAAAPDLLAALVRIEHDWDGEPEDMAEAREAIAKALGKS